MNIAGILLNAVLRLTAKMILPPQEVNTLISVADGHVSFRVMA
jgi:hypothetical protein